jgi:hypothetical protein
MMIPISWCDCVASLTSRGVPILCGVDGLVTIVVVGGLGRTKPDRINLWRREEKEKEKKR